MTEREWPEEAREHFERGYEAQMAGRLEEAIDRYGRSLAIHPTAEAHTFLGWALSFQGKHEEAILNLARVYVRQHKVREAIRELEGAIAIEPRDTVARQELHRLIGLLN